jgi:enamine deaminase RidA (YjgF/YER057c/UK114 family)
MPLERIQPAGLAKPPTYSHVIRAGNTVYIAGQTAQDEQGQVVGKGDVTAQARQVFENLKKALASVGADLSSLVKITVYLTDPRFREPVSEVRQQYLGGNLPTSTLVIVAGLASPDYLLEIEGIAILSS